MINSEAPLVNDVSTVAPLKIENVDENHHQKEIFRTKRSYVPVELDKRSQLIHAVEEEGLTIKEAAHNLKINYSTAKHIVKVFKRTGEVQTQMMTKRLPERDVQQLEYLTFKPSNNQQTFNQQVVDSQQSQSHLRHSYQMMGGMNDIQNQQTSYKRLNLGDQLTYSSNQNYYPVVQQQPQIAVQQLQSLLRQQQIAQLQQNNGAGFTMSNLNIGLQNQLSGDTQLVKPIPMNRQPQQLQMLQQPHQHLLQPQSQLQQVQQLNQLQILNQQYLEQVASRNMLLIANGLQASGLTPQNPQAQINNLQQVQQQILQTQQLQQQRQQMAYSHGNTLQNLQFLNQQTQNFQMSGFPNASAPIQQQQQ